ncbi:hypothetical protein J7S47_22765, partial [Citrobacter freundii]|nr:hypothetical protein [Citrobacter freundii]MBQ0233704.1 hypothetical protein [Citrobacter freundii]MBQ0251460.1 hypothetical protein [Citrobacter freundii]
FIVGGPVGDFELLLCHGTVCVVGKIRDLILQLSKSSIYSTKPGSQGLRDICGHSATGGRRQRRYQPRKLIVKGFKVIHAIDSRAHR